MIYMRNLSLKYRGAITLAIIGFVAFVYVLSATIYVFSIGFSGGPTPSIPIGTYFFVGLMVITSFIFLIIVPLLFLKEIKSSEFLGKQIDTRIKRQNTG